MDVPGQGHFSVALLGLHRYDQRLLAVAEGLGPLIGSAAARLLSAAPARPAAAHDTKQNGHAGWSQANGIAGPKSKGASANASNVSPLAYSVVVGQARPSLKSWICSKPPNL